jgi:hypothetical protein
MKYSISLCVFLVGCNNGNGQAGSKNPAFFYEIDDDAGVSADAGAPAEKSELATDAGTDAASCPSDMARVSGAYCTEVKQNCLKWLDVDKNGKAIGASEPTRCAIFEKPSVCVGKRVHMDFCMDVYEYPNKKGEYPRVDVLYTEAERICKSQNKRICTEEEWTFACEGEEMLPYPYGYERRSDWCNIDHLGKNFKIPRSQWHTIYMGVPSGSMPKCVSPFGIYDLTGNIDEWAYSSKGSWTKAPYHSVLKGGAWLRNRNRCRKITTAHNGLYYSFYQQGFRCCK